VSGAPFPAVGQSAAICINGCGVPSAVEPVPGGCLAKFTSDLLPKQRISE
jgi:hypothetical protein